MKSSCLKGCDLRLKPNRNRTRDLGFYLVMMVIFIAIILSFTKDTQSQELKYSDLVELFTEERVQSFEVKGNQITMKIRTDKADSAKTDSAKTDSADGDTASSVVDSLLGSTAATPTGRSSSAARSMISRCSIPTSMI